MSGLNSGFELDDEYIQKIEDQPTQEPKLDFNDELEETISLENRISDLLDLATDIEQSSGMTQKYALEAQKLLPGFGGVPVGYYTTLPSITRLKISLEEISKGVWALIAAIIVATIAMIAKVYSWLSGDTATATPAAAAANIEKKEKAVEEMAEVIEEAVAVNAQAESDLRAAPVDIVTESGDHIKVRSYQDYIDKDVHMKYFFNNPEPIFYDIITKGKYFKNIFEVSTSLKNSSHVIIGKINAWKKIYEEKVRVFKTGDAINAVITSRDNETIFMPILLKVDGKEQSLKEVYDLLRTIESKISENTDKKIIFDDVLDRLATLYKSEKEGIKELYKTALLSLKITEEYGESLEGLQLALGSTSKDNTKGYVDTDTGHLLRSSLKVIQDDNMHQANLLRLFMNYTKNITTNSEAVIGYGVKISGKLISDLRSDGEKPEENSGLIKTHARWEAIAKKAYASCNRGGK